MQHDHPPTTLKPKIKLLAAISLVFGSVVGSGIFVSAAPMARYVPDTTLFLAIWLIAGLVTIVAALTQCELAARLPRSGGPYQYLRVAYGDLFGFLYGWTNFVVVGSGAVAAIAFVCASYLSEFITLPPLLSTWADFDIVLPILGTIYPFAHFNIKLMAAAIIVGLTILNVRGVHLAMGFQTISSTAKLIAIFAVIAGILLFNQETTLVDGTLPTAVTASLPVNNMDLLMAITLAMAGAFWAYDGWGTITYLSDEVVNPRRNIPYAILIGTALFVSLYLLINYAYTVALPIETIGHIEGDRVATAAMYKVFGTTGAVLISALIALSTFDCTNATVITNARIYHAMAHANVFWRFAGHVHARHETPHVALWLQGVWALCLLFTGSFETLISMYVFVNWLMYGALGLSLFIIRRRRIGEQQSEYRVPGYPFTPLVFIAFAGFYLVFTLVADVTAFARGQQPFLNSVAGLLLLLLGIPFYRLWKSGAKVDEHISP